MGALEAAIGPIASFAYPHGYHSRSARARGPPRRARRRLRRRRRPRLHRRRPVRAPARHRARGHARGGIAAADRARESGATAAAGSACRLARREARRRRAAGRARWRGDRAVSSATVARGRLGNVVYALLVAGAVALALVPRYAGTPPGDVLLSEPSTGARLDGSTWRTCHWWADRGCTIASNDELESYWPEQARVRDGKLELVAERQSRPDSEGVERPDVSGMISTGPGPEAAPQARVPLREGGGAGAHPQRQGPVVGVLAAAGRPRVQARDRRDGGPRRRPGHARAPRALARARRQRREPRQGAARAGDRRRLAHVRDRLAAGRARRGSSTGACAGACAAGRCRRSRCTSS